MLVGARSGDANVWDVLGTLFFAILVVVGVKGGLRRQVVEDGG